MLEIPSQAIEVFERLTNTTISFHQYHPLFGSFPRRSMIHNFPVCSKMKKISDLACVRMDYYMLRADLWKYGDGAVKICHAGVFEWLLPISHDGAFIALLFAGLRKPPIKLPDNIPVIKPKSRCHKFDLTDVPETNAREVADVLEALRQLAARLLLWFIDMKEQETSTRSNSRADIIHHYFLNNFSLNPTLKGLADVLYLSPSRTAHLVREETGLSFSALLMRSRLNHAVELLRRTSLPISVVSEQSGFGNISHFFRAFKKHFQQTPAEYRKGVKVQ